MVIGAISPAEFSALIIILLLISRVNVKILFAVALCTAFNEVTEILDCFFFKNVFHYTLLLSWAICIIPIHMPFVKFFAKISLYILFYLLFLQF